MLAVNDSGTDLEFDAANFYPDKPPKDTKQLENLRKKKAKVKGFEYEATKKTETKYREFEKDAIIEIIEDIGKNPEKYNYTQRYGWSRTDVSLITRDYLYKLRQENPRKYAEIPYRNAASIGSKFISWELPTNKESFDKGFIAKYETAKNVINKNAKKGTTSANDTLNEFGKEITEEKLKKAQKKIKILTTDNKMKETISGAMDTLKGIMGDIKTEKSVEDKQKHTNRYVDSTLMQSLNDYTPANNERYLAKHSVRLEPVANTQQQRTIDTISIKNVDQCIKFVTKYNNTNNSPYDEVNDKMKSDVECCEKILFDENKCYKLGRKYAALIDPVLKLSDSIILNQLALTAKILL